MKKAGKTARPFMYDLNQMHYDYTVEVRNRFKGLDHIDRVPDELWNEVHDIIQEFLDMQKGAGCNSVTLWMIGPPIGGFLWQEGRSVSKDSKNLSEFQI